MNEKINPKLEPFIVAMDSLYIDPANARLHGERNIEAIAASLMEFGQQKPIVVDAKGRVVAGNGTLEAAKILGWDNIAAIVSDIDSEATLSAYAIADNRTAELADWNFYNLEQKLTFLKEQDFDLSKLYLDDLKLDILKPKEEEDEVPEVPKEARAKRGDIYILGGIIVCPKCGKEHKR